MYIISIKDQEDDGAYAAIDDDGEKILYLFVDHDDAERYAGLLMADDFPEMSVVEVEDDLSVKTCEMYGYRYIIIPPDEFIIPPQKYDNIQADKMA